MLDGTRRKASGLLRDFVSAAGHSAEPEAVRVAQALERVGLRADFEAAGAAYPELMALSGEALAKALPAAREKSARARADEKRRSAIDREGPAQREMMFGRPTDEVVAKLSQLEYFVDGRLMRREDIAKQPAACERLAREYALEVEAAEVRLKHLRNDAAMFMELADRHGVVID